MEEAKLMTNCIWRNVFVDIMDKLKVVIYCRIVHVLCEFIFHF